MDATRRRPVSVVIPCYHSAGWLPELTQRLSAALEGAVGDDYEIVLVNDGSTDETWEVIEKLAVADDRVVGIDLLRNSGQFRALMCGLEHASGDLVVTMDDDLQHRPEEVPKLLAELERRPDLDAVIAEYAQEKQHSAVRNLGSRAIRMVFRSSYGMPAGLKMSSFRAMRRPVVEAMLSFGTVRPVPGALLVQSTQRLGNVPVVHEERPYGTSGYSFRKLLRLMVDNLVNGSTAPLRLMSALGFAASLVAAGLLIFYLIGAALGSIRLPGFTTLVLLVIFFGGTTLMAVGVLGEYVARLVSEATRPPRYRVRSSTRDRHE